MFSIKNLRVLAALYIASIHYAGYSAPAEWMQFFKNSGSVVYFMDAHSMQKNGVIARVWVRAISPTIIAGSDERRSYDEVHCTQRKTRALRIVYFYQGNSLSEGEPTDWEYPMPGTAYSSLIDRICKR